MIVYYVFNPILHGVFEQHILHGGGKYAPPKKKNEYLPQYTSYVLEILYQVIFAYYAHYY